MFWGIINALLAFLLQISFFSRIPIFGFYPNVLIIVVALAALFFRQSILIYSVLFTAFIFELYSIQMSGFYVVWGMAALAVVVVLKKNVIRRFNAVLGLLLLFALEALFMLFRAAADIWSGSTMDILTLMSGAAGSFALNTMICGVVYLSVWYLHPRSSRFL